MDETRAGSAVIIIARRMNECMSDWLKESVPALIQPTKQTTKPPHNATTQHTHTQTQICKQ